MSPWAWHWTCCLNLSCSATSSWGLAQSNTSCLIAWDLSLHSHLQEYLTNANTASKPPLPGKGVQIPIFMQPHKNRPTHKFQDMSITVCTWPRSLFISLPNVFQKKNNISKTMRKNRSQDLWQKTNPPTPAFNNSGTIPHYSKSSFPSFNLYFGLNNLHSWEKWP